MSGPERPAAGESITSLLSMARNGDPAALDRVFRYTYAELHRVAKGHLGEGPSGATLGATALVNAACERLLGAQRLDAENRRHFFFILSRAMHDVVVEHARAQGAAKRGGGHQRAPLVEIAADGRSQTFAAADLHAALDALHDIDPEAAQVVMLRFLCGRTLEEAAELMGCTFAVARRHWDYAKAWLGERLSGGSAAPATSVAPSPG
jgi:RNA polymerase sigma factor (TIGR02999 family)